MQQLFYNKRRKQYCQLTTVPGGYLSYGKPATLRGLAKLGWRISNKNPEVLNAKS